MVRDQEILVIVIITVRRRDKDSENSVATDILRGILDFVLSTVTLKESIIKGRKENLLSYEDGDKAVDYPVNDHVDGIV